MYRNLFLAACLAGAAVATPATAETIRVGYADLDLSRPEGVDTLRRRIKMAAVRLCGESDVRALDSFQEVLSCRAEAEAKGFAQLKQASLTAGQRLAAADVKTLHN